MKYSGMARFMWPIYRRSFRSALINVLGHNRMSADRIMRSAKERYRSIIGKLPEFEKEDIFKTNILSCSMLIAVLQSLDKRPMLQDTTEYYKQAITISSDDLLSIVTLKDLSDSLMDRIRFNYRAIVGFNTGLIILGLIGVLPPSMSALLHNTSTIMIGLKSTTKLLDTKK